MDYQERTESFLELQAEEDKSHMIGQPSMENDTQHSASRHPIYSRTPRTEWDIQQLVGRSLLQLDFQDSQLSPALLLRPSNSQHNFTEDSLFQQTDLEFAPLREYPDMSVASERLLFTPRECGPTYLASERGSLSQHPLTQASPPAEDTESCGSYCSLSEHSMSPGDETGRSAKGRLTATGHAGIKPSRSHLSGDGTGSVGRYYQTPSGPGERPMTAAVEDTTFLSGQIPARHLFELLQKDVGMPSGSSSAVSMASETSVNRATPLLDGGSGQGVLLAAGMERRETARRQCLGKEEEEEEERGRGGGASSLPPEQSEPPSRRSTSRMSEIQNITVRSSSSQQDDSSDALRQELLLEIERNRGEEAGRGATPLPRPVTANRKPLGRPSTTLGARSEGMDPPSIILGAHSVGIDLPITMQGASSKGMDPPNTMRSARSVGVDPPSTTRGARSEGMDPPSITLGARSVGMDLPITMQGARSEGMNPPNTMRSARSVGVDPPSTTRGARSEGYSIQQGYVERELWSSGSQTGIDGSLLCSHPKPMSQSTPGVFHAPVQSGVKAPGRRLSAIESNAEASYQSASLPAVAAMPYLEATDPDGQRRELDLSPQQSAQEVQALPCLNYLQKVDAWRANQNSGGRSSLFENLSLEGCSGGSAKLRGLDNVCEQPLHTDTHSLVQKSVSTQPLHTDTHSLVQQAGSTQPLHTDTHSLPLSRSLPSSPRRGEAVGSAPSEKATYGAGGGGGGGGRGPLASLPGHSQSHSSLSTVVMSTVQTQQQQQQQQQQDGPTPPPCDLSLGSFNYAPSHPEILSSPQESFHSSANVCASAAASSVVSLEVDNYAPYWNSKPRSPSPREPELNIEDRIPVYLLNLGIEQSPSSILTPFGPRGPIREPEFSPTSVCTVRGGGTSSKSTQPSEGGSPQKGEGSRFSQLSAGSSASIPMSVDSLHPAVGPSEQGRRRPPSPPESEPNPGLQAPAPGPALEQRESSAVELAEQSSSADSSLFTEARYRDLGAGVPPAGPGGEAEKKQNSLVGSRTLQEIRQLLGPAETTVPGRSPPYSPSSGRTGASSHLLHSEDDLMMLLRRCKMLRDSSFASSSMGDPKHLSSSDSSSFSSSVLWGRSSSDSMLTSERLRESYSEAPGGLLCFSASSRPGFRPGDGSGGAGAGDTAAAAGASGTGFSGSGRGTAAAGSGGSVGTGTGGGGGAAPGTGGGGSGTVGTGTAGVTGVGFGGGFGIGAGAGGTSTGVTAAAATDGTGVSTAGTGTGGGVSQSLVSQPTRRAEPEGCSAAPPDALGPLRPSVSPVTKPPTSGGQSHPAAPEQPDQNAGPGPERRQSPAEAPPLEEPAGLVNSGRPASPLPTQGGALSDGGSSSSSSGGSLAARVTSLLQRESPATMVSSSLASTGELEESRAREWIKLKVSGLQCEALPLNMVDRQRIEEIKRELLLSTRYVTQSQGSSDAERSQSSVGQSEPVQNQHLHQGEFAAQKAAERRLSQRIQRLKENPPDPGTDLVPPLMLDLEARVLEIALREGLSLGRPYTPPLTSITIATCRRADTPPPSPAPELLHVTQLSADGVSLPAAQGLPPQQTQEEEEGGALPQDSSSEQLSASEASSSLHTGVLPLEAEEEEEPQVGGAGAGHQQQQEQTLSLEREEASGGRGGGGQEEQPLDSLEREEVMERGPTLQQRSRDWQEATSHSEAPQHPDSSPGFASALDPPTRPDHVSHLHLTLSSKALGVLASGSSSSSRLQASEFVPLRPSSSTYTLSSQDRAGPSRSAIGSQESWEPIRRHDRPDASVHYQPTVATTSGFPQCFTPPQRLAGPSSRPVANHTPVPVLLPYKPPGSEEVFYVPQTEALPSPICSDTTMESTHPGSDDAVAPSFSAEVLGTRAQEQPGDPGVDIKHTEGLYSKKRKGGRYSNRLPSEPSGIGSRMSYDEGNQTSNMSKAWTPIGPRRDHNHSHPAPSGPRRDHHHSHPAPSGPRRDHSHPAPAGPRRDHSHPAPSGPRRDHHHSHPAPTGPRRDQGTMHSAQPEDSEDFGPMGVEMDYSMDPGSTEPAPRRTGSLVDQLWNRFSQRWGLEDPHPINEREVLLVERLAHLSRLLDSRGMTLSEAEEVAQQRPSHPPGAHDPARPRGRTEDRGMNKRGRKKRSAEEDGGSRKRRGDDRGRREKGGGRSGGRRAEAGGAGPRQAWTLESQVQTDSEPTPPSAEQQQQQEGEEDHDEEEEEGSVAESLSSGSSRSRHLCPAERDVSETCSSVSTVDTARLIRAFGSYRIRGLKTGGTSTLDAMNKLYSTIEKQRKDTEQRKSAEQRKDTETRKSRGKSKEKTHNIPPQTTDTSTVTADSASSSDTYGLPSQPDPAHEAARSRKPVRLVSKSIQTGDLEIVINATRRHTRDVGTTFPSPGHAPGPRGGLLKERRGRRKVYPQAVSWFVSAEHLRAEARKENEPEQQSAETPSEVWFEPHSRTRPWRDPLRQRQLHDDRDDQNRPRNTPDPEASEQAGVTSALVRVSLQEALELRRPEFISKSRERSKRLALLAEERKLQEVLDRERAKLFNRPTGPPSRMPLRPAGPVLSKHAVPKREMVQRSRRRSEVRESPHRDSVEQKGRLGSIYEQLPEVRKRREEERRKAEYHSYRLNAQLYNKRVTNRVLGRRSPWQ